MVKLWNEFGLIKYSWLLQQLVSRDLKIKYRRSVLGYLWSVLNPLMLMTIMTIVFSTVFRFDIPNFPVYLLAGQLIFGFFGEATSMSMQSILGSASLIKKVYLPKYIFPVSRVLSSFTTMFFSLMALFIVMAFTDVVFTEKILLLPVLLVYLLVFCTGVGLILATFVVYFRDIEYLYTVLLTALNYLTPIFYPISILPEPMRENIIFNPLYNYITFFRNIMLYGKWPTLNEHLLCIGFAALALAVGMYVFKKHENDFVLHI